MFIFLSDRPSRPRFPSPKGGGETPSSGMFKSASSSLQVCFNYACTPLIRAFQERLWSTPIGVPWFRKPGGPVIPHGMAKAFQEHFTKNSLTKPGYGLII